MAAGLLAEHQELLAAHSVERRTVAGEYIARANCGDTGSFTTSSTAPTPLVKVPQLRAYLMGCGKTESR